MSLASNTWRKGLDSTSTGVGVGVGRVRGVGLGRGLGGGRGGGMIGVEPGGGVIGVRVGHVSQLLVLDVVRRLSGRVRPAVVFDLTALAALTRVDRWQLLLDLGDHQHHH
eukprot:CAMPEP_0174232650 /NCGR_PEP_ID=MMETSP0417-20130205/2879_1 /TAXON_ID=242541 /ORGANISM="Mayorella sp, Strain BSH-02190019" /LENGTH=109 /DNA_ID=CAMNT_0015310733 /DNA_START=277 /DNA_END=603 /DNA_ORIENTATION=+